MSQQENSIYRLFKEMWNEQNLDVANEIFDQSVIFHMPTGESFDLSEFKDVVLQFFKAFPDIIHQVDDLFQENEKIAVRWHGQGTQQGEIDNLSATGKPFHYAGITIFYFNQRNKIIAVWIFNNFTDMLMRLKQN